MTAGAGLNVPCGFGQGVAVGDYDNDGHDDLLVTRLGGLNLFHNVPDPAAPGGRRFVDVTPQSGLANPHWSSSAAWGNLNGDGLLDLYICNYVELDPAKPMTCKDEQKNLYYTCAPGTYPYAAHCLFENRGDGKFVDVSQSSGIAQTPAPGLAVLIMDLDEDGKQDIYVANDMTPAFLFRNLGGMKFEEIGRIAGAALGPGGSRISGMGVEAADFAGAGRPDLFITNYQKVPNVLFLNRGRMRFDEMSFQSGLGGPSLEPLTFGTCALDADLDGNPDLAVANGHVHRYAREIFGAQYAQAAQLFTGDGKGSFKDASTEAGSDFVKPRVGRGMVRADFNRDGLPDLAMSCIGEPICLLKNRITTSNNWVALDLIGDGRSSNRNAIGATAKVEWVGGSRTFFVIGGGSYLSANERILHVGMGAASKIDRVTIRWPSGKVQQFSDLPAKSRWRLREGVAQPDPAK